MHRVQGVMRGGQEDECKWQEQHKGDATPARTSGLLELSCKSKRSWLKHIRNTSPCRSKKGYLVFRTNLPGDPTSANHQFGYNLVPRNDDSRISSNSLKWEHGFERRGKDVCYVEDMTRVITRQLDPPPPLPPTPLCTSHETCVPGSVGPSTRGGCAGHQFKPEIQRKCS